MLQCAFCKWRPKPLWSRPPLCELPVLGVLHAVHRDLRLGPGGLRRPVVYNVMFSLGFHRLGQYLRIVLFFVSPASVGPMDLQMLKRNGLVVLGFGRPWESFLNNLLVRARRDGRSRRTDGRLAPACTRGVIKSQSPWDAALLLGRGGGEPCTS